ncbi:hypothetical protein OESDEN_03276 [Oesophagostomum dentatum]|uniref:C2H2-type domain-containing protein n=1 Tax=Oesophagostomum dentatum TaxID=61180 RepID=A0A0B1TKZ2_OESDE|nr:hypothetical protein OESDEN_03276 [Oesophagostomum dentatum]
MVWTRSEGMRGPMEGTVAKKPRVWNPAVDTEVTKDKLSPEPSQSSSNPMDFSRTPNPALPLLIQNYFHLARFQQQRVVEEAMRRGLMPSFPNPTMPSMSMRQPTIPAMLTPPQAMGSLLPSTPTVSTQSGAVNPIVQSALGVPIANENCCAICGAAFRLTADLVQHMRNNHRKTRFKRKNEKSFV